MPFSRRGNPLRGYPGIEPILYKYGVDLSFWGHEHHYERMYPVFNKRVLVSDTHEPYHNPKAPIHIVTGIAGNREWIHDFNDRYYRWSAYRSTEFGYTKLNIVNSTHAIVEQVAVANNQSPIRNSILTPLIRTTNTTTETQDRIIDSVTIVQENHGPFQEVYNSIRN